MPQYIYYQWKQYPVPIQYSLPKWINSVEAGLLIDGTLEDEDILSIFYDWAQRWIVKIVKRGNNINIIKTAWLPDDAKIYERYIYHAFFDGITIFKHWKINLVTARILIMDYCFNKWWIQDFMPQVKQIVKATRWTTRIMPVFLASLFFVFMTVTEIPMPGIVAVIFAILIKYPFDLLFEFWYIGAEKVYMNKLKAPIKYTHEWTKLAGELLWYKKYLDQIKISCKNKNIKENILIKDWTAGDNIALKSDNTPNIMKALKKYTYVHVKALWKYYEHCKSWNRSLAYRYNYFDDHNICESIWDYMQNLKTIKSSKNTKNSTDVEIIEV